MDPVMAFCKDELDAGRGQEADQAWLNRWAVPYDNRELLQVERLRGSKVTPHSPSAIEWMKQWRAAAVALERDRRDALRSLTPERALAASEALLSLADPTRLNDSRRRHSGLVEMQALFSRLRR